MSRVKWKGPFLDKIFLKQSNIKTNKLKKEWSRKSTISSNFLIIAMVSKL